MDERPNNAGVYLLGGGATVIALVWIASYWWV